MAEELICAHGGKVRYASSSKATRDAKRKKRLGRLPAVMEPYRCTYCGDWHLTHRSRAEARSLNMVDMALD